MRTEPITSKKLFECLNRLTPQSGNIVRYSLYFPRFLPELHSGDVIVQRTGSGFYVIVKSVTNMSDLVYVAVI